jgi:hypothetical protein
MNHKMQSDYRAQAINVSLETDMFEFSLLRKKSNYDRLQMSAALSQGSRKLCLYGLRQTHAFLAEQDFAQLIAQAFLGENYPHEFIPTGNEMTWIQDSITLAIQLQTLLTSLEIPHFITGGVAAATYGEPRTTRDLDMVIALKLSQLDILVTHLEIEGFYIPGVEDIRFGRLQTLSITHHETIARADLIIASDSEFDRIQFDRIRAIQIPERGILYMASPEDLILSKLRWINQSEKQWRDILGILKIQQLTLNFSYLSKQATLLGLTTALTQAMAESGLDSEYTLQEF